MNDLSYVSSSCIRHNETKKKKSLVKFAVQNIFWGLPLEENKSTGEYFCRL